MLFKEFIGKAFSKNDNLYIKMVNTLWKQKTLEGHLWQATSQKYGTKYGYGHSLSFPTLLNMLVLKRFGYQMKCRDTM